MVVFKGMVGEVVVRDGEKFVVLEIEDHDGAPHSQQLVPWDGGLQAGERIRWWPAYPPVTTEIGRDGRRLVTATRVVRECDLSEEERLEADDSIRQQNENARRREAAAAEARALRERSRELRRHDENGGRAGEKS